MENLIYYGMFYIVVLIIIFSFRKNIVNSNDEIMGVYTSKQLKGVAILCVLLGHLTIMFNVLKLPVTDYLGAQAVEIFLFLSSFGLLCSYKKNGLKGFVKKRLSVIFVPYIIFVIIRTILMVATGMEFDIVTLLKNIFVLDVSIDASMWYIQYIIIWYVIFFIVFSLKNIKIRDKVTILTAIGGILIIISTILMNTGIMNNVPLGECISHHLSFPLGAIFFLYYDKLKVLNKNTYILVSIIAFVVYMIASKFIPNLVPYYLTNVSFIVFIVSLFMLLSKSGYKSKLLCWLGDLAYYIYLNELMVMFIAIAVLGFNTSFVVIPILVISILLAMIVKIPCNFILKKIK